MRLPELWSLLGSAMAAPVQALLKADERIHWGYLLLSLLLALVVGVRRSPRDWRHLAGRTVDALKTWLTDPNLHFDLRFMVARALLDSVALGSAALSAVAIAVGLRPFAHELVGGALPVPEMVGLLLITVASFITDDLARYGAHRAFHQVPFLWQIHQVHHSTTRLSPLSIYRTHPVEGLTMQTVTALSTGATVGVLSGLFGVSMSVWEIAGVHGLSVVYNALGSNLRHSHVWLVYPPWLARCFISPAEHQMHHGRAADYHDANYGTVFAWWDRLFSTHLPAPAARPADLEFGLEEGEQNHRPTVLSALLAPLGAAARVLLRMRKQPRCGSQPFGESAGLRPASTLLNTRSSVRHDSGDQMVRHYRSPLRPPSG